VTQFGLETIYYKGKCPCEEANVSLTEYVRKRKFNETPEPKPSEVVPKNKTEGRFFIQRHDATRLHYDFRLEIG